MEDSILSFHIKVLAENLQRTKAALDSKIFDAQEITSELRKSVRNHFEWRLNKMENQLSKLKGQPSDGNWNSFLKIQEECKGLFNECLDFVEGALLRGAGLDNKICLVADALIDSLSYKVDIHWERPTIMATEELFNQISKIIHLRFPDFDILQLPVVAHELGHFIGEEVRKERPDDFFKKILDEESEKLKEHRFLHELFADLFAVFALGPAYACTCIMRNFDPVKAHQDKPLNYLPDYKTHPADGKRVYFILKALKVLDQDVSKPYLGIRDHLEKLWEQNIKAVGTPWPLDKKDIERLDQRLQNLLDLIMYPRLSNVRYKGWSRANVLADNRLSDGGRDQKLELPDILNAAWICRLSYPDEYQARNIGKQSLELCLYLAGVKN